MDKRVLFLSLFLFCILCLAGCVRCSKNRNGYWNSRGRTQSNASKVVKEYFNDVWNYQAGTYFIRAGVSMQEVVCQNNSFLILDEQRYGLGGSKLIGEMSADASGEYRSRPSEDKNIPIGTPSELRLSPLKDPNSIVSGIVKRELNVYVNPIESCGLGEALASIFSGESVATLRVTIDVTNITKVAQTVVVECGQMIEAEKEDVQNIVVCKRVVAAIPPGCSETMRLECMCAAHYRKSPVGSRAKLTPYRLDASASVFEKQQRVWDFISGITIDPSPHTSRSRVNIGGHGRKLNSGHKGGERGERVGTQKLQRKNSKNIEKRK